MFYVKSYDEGETLLELGSDLKAGVDLDVYFTDDNMWLFTPRGYVPLDYDPAKLVKMKRVPGGGNN